MIPGKSAPRSPKIPQHQHTYKDGQNYQQNGHFFLGQRHFVSHLQYNYDQTHCQCNVGTTRACCKESPCKKHCTNPTSISNCFKYEEKYNETDLVTDKTKIPYYSFACLDPTK